MFPFNQIISLNDFRPYISNTYVGPVERKKYGCTRNYKVMMNNWETYRNFF